MKTADIATANGFDIKTFEKFVTSSGKYKFQKSIFAGTSVNDEDVESIVADFNQIIDEALNAQRESERAVADKQRAMAQMLITSGFNFDGYTIKKYSGYISGDAAVQVDRGREGIFSRPANVGDGLMDALSQIRREALIELKEAAYALGCNAVIGVDFDYLTLDPETVNANGGTLYLPYIFGVTANGNAVIIEKND